MTRQAISPRFAIRILLNMFFLLELLGRILPRNGHAGRGQHTRRTAKIDGGNGLVSASPCQPAAIHPE
jgi:hypothetical protein